MHGVFGGNANYYFSGNDCSIGEHWSYNPAFPLSWAFRHEECSEDLSNYSSPCLFGGTPGDYSIIGGLSEVVVSSSLLP